MSCFPNAPPRAHRSMFDVRRSAMSTAPGEAQPPRQSCNSLTRCSNRSCHSFPARPANPQRDWTGRPIPLTNSRDIAGSSRVPNSVPTGCPQRLKAFGHSPEVDLDAAARRLWRGEQCGMWVALALERSDEYMRWRTCLRCKAANSKKLPPAPDQNRWHQPCYWLPFTLTVGI